MRRDMTREKRKEEDIFINQKLIKLGRKVRREMDGNHNLLRRLRGLFTRQPLSEWKVEEVKGTKQHWASQDM